jgi:hypothetical protein
MLHGAWLAGLLGVGLLACSQAPAAVSSAAPTTVQELGYRDQGGSTSEVQRLTFAPGDEMLHGRTELHRGAGTTEIVEDVHVDGAGSLMWAVVTTGGSGDERAKTRIVFERASQTVRVESRDEVVHFQVPADAPWVYGPAEDGTGPTTTPVAGWIEHRATQAASFVRLIDVARRMSYRVPSDQVAFALENETMVVLRSDSIEVGDGFVQEVRLTDLGIRLTRIDGRLSALPSPGSALHGHRARSAAP